MNKREQKAIETAADNCEVLRARLAKYEDAEGRPVSTIAEQAQQIQRLQEGQDILIFARDEQKRLANEYRDLWSRAALKAQPARVVLPEPLKRGDEGGSGEYGAAMISGYNACLREVARLNSSSVSAGDGRVVGTKVSDAAINCWSCKLSVSLDERADADGNCPHCRVELDLEEYLRAALSAPSHGEQVERLQMQLVACGVVALANTPESAARARDMHPDYMSASCSDVMRAVDREMHQRADLLDWAVERWHAEVSQRPLVNVNRRSIDDTWRQIIRRLGGDPVDLCGPDHDTLIAAAPSAGSKKGGE